MRLKISDNFAWGLIIIFWVTLMTLIALWVVGDTKPVTYIQFNPDTPPTRIEEQPQTEMDA